MPIRTVAGMPPFGQVRSARFSIPRLTLAVLGPPMGTGGVLSDADTVTRIRDAALPAMDSFVGSPSCQSLYEQSNAFSRGSGMESREVSRVLSTLHERGHAAGMCMLGNSVFTDAPEEELWAILGRGHVRTFRCSSSHREAIVRRG